MAVVAQHPRIIMINCRRARRTHPLGSGYSIEYICEEARRKREEKYARPTLSPPFSLLFPLTRFRNLMRALLEEIMNEARL